MDPQYMTSRRREDRKGSKQQQRQPSPQQAKITFHDIEKMLPAAKHNSTIQKNIRIMTAIPTKAIIVRTSTIY